MQQYVGSRSRATFENEILPWLYHDVKLNATRSAAQLTFHWPTNAANFVLESAASLSSPQWTAAGITPQVVNGRNTVSLPAPGLNRLYRLRLQR